MQFKTNVSFVYDYVQLMFMSIYISYIFQFFKIKKIAICIPYHYQDCWWRETTLGAVTKNYIHCTF